MMYAFFISGYVWNICECLYAPYAYVIYVYMWIYCYVVCLEVTLAPCFLLFVFGRSVARWTLRGPF